MSSPLLCTCGAIDPADVDTGIVGLPESPLVDQLARALRMDPAIVRRVIFGVPHVLGALSKENAEALIAYQQRELIAVLKRLQEKADARQAAIAAAGRRAEG